jgi:DNA-binding transcriptional LysR family regulator
MNYTLNQLQVFLKIAQTLSVTKAAEELHLTQPAVSIQLKNFQGQFEIPLTEVVGRKIADAAEQILNQVHAINYKTLAYKGQLSGRLKLSIVSTGKYVMPYFLAGFMKQHPGAELIMDVTNKAKVIESLGNNEVDFSLVSIIPENLSVNKISLIENKLYLVGSSETKNHLQADIKHLFEQVPLIFREDGSGTRQVMEKFISKNRLLVTKKMKLTSNEAVKQAVLAGLGLSVMPLIGIKKEVQAGELKIIPVKGLPLKTNWSLIWLKGKKLSPVAASFIKYINDKKNEIIQTHFSISE